ESGGGGVDLSIAEACYGRALEQTPGNAEIHVNRALLNLLRGRFAEGWDEYEWRWKKKDATPPSFREPEWTGEPLNGRTILVYCEQGFGDSIQFVRYAPLVKEMGGHLQ